MSTIPDNFNWKMYLFLNSDLNQNCNEEEANNHYINYGIMEQRKYKIDDFDWKTYLLLNQDLDQKTMENEAFDHFVNYGMYENRKYQIDTHETKEYLELNSHEIHEMLHTITSNYNFSDISMFSSKPVINSSSSNFIKLDDIYENLPRGYHNSKEKINIDVISSCILIIDFNNAGGGTSVFLESILSKYKKYQTFLIARMFDEKIFFTINDEYELEESYEQDKAPLFICNNIDKIEKIFINHTKSHTYEFLDFLFKINKEITTITHDLSLLFNECQIIFNDIDNYIVDSSKSSKININKYDKIITQNIANLHIYNNYIVDKSKIIISPLPDYKFSKDLINTSNTNIVVGLIGEINDYKGRLELEKIINYYKKSNITIVIFGNSNLGSFENKYPYKNVHELNKFLMYHKPNVLLELSIWPETYCYTLTLAMLTQLPILYLKKNGYSVVEERLSKYTKSFPFTCISDLDTLINSKKQDYFYTIEPIIYFNEIWDSYFITKKEKKNIITKKNKYDIKPYIIYFPQFHEIKENNISFYPGFSDIKNLDLLSKSNMNINIETPSLKEFNLTEFTEYDYMNKKSILQKQIDIIDDYNISGFAIYYYWFSTNTITEQNLIMENVTNQFFDGSIDMKNKKCFLIWANESWTNNPAFGTTNQKIESDYSNPETFEKISENLLTYFKNNTYLKIDNKPVFELHHPWFVTLEQIDIFYNIINNKCIQNDFNGIHFIVNSINGSYDKYLNRCHHFNYKKTKSCFFDYKSKNNFLDYKLYLKNDIRENKNELQTLVFDFNNKARLFKPDKLCKATTCINNTEINKILFMEKIINKYNKDTQSEVEKILLINSWNEWGEKMAIEPSEEYGYYYLNLLNERLM
jgi:hypothetical protein